MTQELEVEVKEEKKSFDYREYLKKQGNTLLDIDFLNNDKERIKKLSFKLTDNILDIRRYLAALSVFELNLDIDKVKDFLYDQADYRESYQQIFQSYRSHYNKVDQKDYRSSPSKYSYYAMVATRLPYCCGVSEYGNFNFLADTTKEITQLRYALIIDLIRLHSMYHRRVMSGAYSMINYFVDTSFCKVLEKREDITFIKQFTNPKTSATLKTFIFDSLIQ